jgi:hypothetical protein
MQEGVWSRGRYDTGVPCRRVALCEETTSRSLKYSWAGGEQYQLGRLRKERIGKAEMVNAR